MKALSADIKIEFNSIKNKYIKLILDKVKENPSDCNKSYALSLTDEYNLLSYANDIQVPNELSKIVDYFIDHQVIEYYTRCSYYDLLDHILYYIAKIKELYPTDWQTLNNEELEHKSIDCLYNFMLERKITGFTAEY